MKKILIIFGSSRSNGNTMKAVESVILNRNVEIVDLLDKQVSYFDYEHRNNDDDFIPIVEKMVDSDTIIFATPIYWYSMSAHLKTFFDRLTDLLDIHKNLGRSLKEKTCYLIATGTDKEMPLGFEQVFARTADYFDMVYKGCFYYFVKKNKDMSDEIKEAAKNWGDRIFIENS